ncbi:MAG TPA: O-antigen ligase family protein, partial [Pyrinomonadaceae bacterium]|nr:O-antigen ligase family protein [Pyrinomonadaceae bacterium]
MTSADDSPTATRGDAPTATAPHTGSPALRLAERVALCGLLLYATFAPHSIAGAWIALSAATCGWLLRTLVTRRTGVRRSPLDLPLWLFYAWSVLSALFSAEPRISLLKLISVSTFLIFYLVQSLVTRGTAVLVAALLIASGGAGALWSAFEVVRGRGLVVEQIAPDSPLRDATLRVEAGDSIWRVNGRRIHSTADIDSEIRNTPAGEPLKLSLFSQGEQVERVGSVVTDETKARPSPSGVSGTRPSHRFRASGWTRHYETFAETLQILAQLALGFTLARLQRRAARRTDKLRAALYAAAFVLLAAGIALTAMRTVLVAFAVGACVIAWRAVARGRARLVVSLFVALALAVGAFAVWRTRATGALRLQDDSARLRFEVARVALSRIPSRPLLGHGMDAVKRHWSEWGFPGDVQIHTHSTPIQLAFDRGLPALLLWLWLLAAFWLTATRAEKRFRTSDDAGTHG